MVFDGFRSYLQIWPPPIKLLRRLQLAFVQQNHNLCSLANASRPYIVNGRLVAKAREKVAALMVKERQAGDRFWEITGFLRIFGLRR